MREAGLTKDDFAAVVVKNRRNGVENPNAMFRKPVTAEEVLASRVVSEPLHLWMLCSPNEGAAAVVLQRAAPTASSCGPRACDRISPAASSPSRRRWPASTIATSRHRRRWPPTTPTPPRGSGRRHRRRRVSGHRRGPRVADVRGAAAVRRANRPSSCALARSISVAAGRSIRAAGCSRRASRSVPRRSAKWSSWCTSCGAKPVPARCKVPAPGWPTRSAAGPTPAW